MYADRQRRSVSGLEVGSIFEEQKVFEVQVWSAPELRDDPAKLAQLPISTPDGNQIALGDVADVTISEQPSLIRREAVQRRIDINAGLDGSAADTRSKVASALRAMSLPSEYHAEVRSEAGAIESNHRHVVLYALFAILAALVLIQAALRNWFLAVGALLALPLAASGGLVAALLAGGDLTLGGIVAVFALVVWAVRNALVGLADESDPALVPTAVTVGLVSLAGVVLGGRPGLESIHDAAVVLLGGTITITFAALIVLPFLRARYASRVEAVDDLSFDDERAFNFGPREVAHA